MSDRYDWVFQGFNFFRLDEIAAAVRTPGGGGEVHLRGGSSFNLNEERFSPLLDALRFWHETRARSGAPRPNPGTDTTDNGLQGT